MLEFLKKKGIKPTPWEVENEISKGYLQKAALSGGSIGSEIVDKFLKRFKGEVDPYWLITGEYLSGNTEKKGTYGDKQQPVDDLSWVKPLAILKDQLEDLKKKQKELQDKLKQIEKEKPAKPALKA